MQHVWAGHSAAEYVDVDGGSWLSMWDPSVCIVSGSEGVDRLRQCLLAVEIIQICESMFGYLGMFEHILQP